MFLLSQQVKRLHVVLRIVSSVANYKKARLYFNLFYYFICRDVDGAIVRPLPRAKRMLSEATCLPHIVQVGSQQEPLGTFGD